MLKLVLFAASTALLVVVNSQFGVPFVSPLLSTFPCRDDNDIRVYFEPAREPKDDNWFYIYANKVFPQDSKLRVIFSAQVNVSLVYYTANNGYSRIYMSESNAFTLILFIPHAGLGFKVIGTEVGVTPYLLSFSIDNMELCREPNVGFLQRYESRRPLISSNRCGRRVMDQAHLIVSGAPTNPGDWPWHAALYKMDGSTIKYTCGGTLISDKFVLTAAHCASYRGARYPADILSVVLGKYTLTGDDKESEEKEIHKVILHERFNYTRLINDIALLKFKTEVVFNEFIRPACIWHGTETVFPTNQMLGTIVGWGFDNSDSLSRTLRQATMPIVSEADCLRSNPAFYSHALNDNTFCAGYHNGTSACNGDSGSAFQIFIPDRTDGLTTSGSWYVKGIVSNTLARVDAPICDPNEYVVFTKVEMYTNWIEKHLIS